MKKKEVLLKQELKKLYQVPEPIEKRAFLQAIQPQYEHISLLEFMWQQMHYMKKWIWFVSGGMVVLFMFLYSYLNEYAVAVVSSFVPFLVVMVLSECSRSRAYFMEELEMATRFSLPSVWLARMGALAILHTMELVIIMLCLKVYQQFVLSSICYILVPYFLTVCVGIFLFRQPGTRDAYSLCFAVPILVSVVVTLSRLCLPILYTKAALEWWLFFLIVLLFFTVKENYLFYRQMKVLA